MPPPHWGCPPPPHGFLPGGPPGGALPPQMGGPEPGVPVDLMPPPVPWDQILPPSGPLPGGQQPPLHHGGFPGAMAPPLQGGRPPPPPLVGPCKESLVPPASRGLGSPPLPLPQAAPAPRGLLHERSLGGTAPSAVVSWSQDNLLRAADPMTGASAPSGTAPAAAGLQEEGSGNGNANSAAARPDLRVEPLRLPGSPASAGRSAGSRPVKPGAGGIELRRSSDLGGISVCSSELWDALPDTERSRAPRAGVTSSERGVSSSSRAPAVPAVLAGAGRQDGIVVGAGASGGGGAAGAPSMVAGSMRVGGGLAAPSATRAAEAPADHPVDDGRHRRHRSGSSKRRRDRGEWGSSPTRAGGGDATAASRSGSRPPRPEAGGAGPGRARRQAL